MRPRGVCGDDDSVQGGSGLSNLVIPEVTDREHRGEAIMWKHSRSGEQAEIERPSRPWNRSRARDAGSAKTSVGVRCRWVALTGVAGLMALGATMVVAGPVSAATVYTVTATIPVGTNPQGVAFDPDTGTIYVPNTGANTVSVIDEASNTVIKTIPVGSGPSSVVVDPAYNTVYVANAGADTVSIINGGTNKVVASVHIPPPADGPIAMAIDTATDTIYTANLYGYDVSVIDGGTYTVTATIPVGTSPSGVSVDLATDTVYVTNGGDNTVSVIDGATNKVTATVAVGNVPQGVAVDQATDNVYVPNFEDNTVSVIYGETNTVVATLPVGNGPAPVDIDQANGTVYVGNTVDDTVSVLDSATDAVTATVAVGNNPAAVCVNQATGTVYVANIVDNTVSVITPSNPPGAPTGVTATAGNASATVSFTAPASDGGSAVTGYTVTATDTTTGANGGQTATGTVSPVTVKGLTNGDSYTFTVTATNVAGPGPASASSNAVTPLSVPGAPTIGHATAGNTRATVAFTPPAADGGSPITTYAVTATDTTTGVVDDTTFFGAASPITAGGLTNGDTYTFTVTATNSVGVGPASAASNPVIPATVPSAPGIPAATTGNTHATVAFTPPASNGGSPVTSYTVTATDTTNPANGGQTAIGTTSPITVTGLTNGDSYTFSVTATNRRGVGPASTKSNQVNPAKPGKPTANLSVAVTGPPTAAPGTSFTETITVTDHGPSPATDIVTALIVPKGLTVTSAGDAATLGARLHWDDRTLAAGAKVTYTVTFEVGTDAPSTAYMAAATASQNVPDPHPANNVAATTVVLI